jgi:hypothetical protein
VANCKNAALISKAWVSGIHHTMLFKISYCGTDACPEPDGIYQMIELDK